MDKLIVLFLNVYLLIGCMSSDSIVVKVEKPTPTPIVINVPQSE